HGDVQCVVRLRRPGTPSATRGPFQRDRCPNGGVDRPAARGGVPLGRRTALLAARSRWALRGRVLEPRALPGNPRSPAGGSIPLAESVRGTPHRDSAPRVPRPCDRLERAPPASRAPRLPRLLPPLPNPPLTGEGRTGAETGGAPRPGRNRRDTHGRGPASSV